MGKLKTASVVLLVVTLAGTNTYFLVDNVNKKKELSVTHGKVIELQSRLDAVGTFTDVFTIKADVKVGAEVKAEDIVKQTVPTSIVGENVITSVDQILGKYYKVSLKPNVTLTKELFMDNGLDGTVYVRDLNMDSLPVGSKVGDYVDIRIVLPYGEEFIAIPHKRINALYKNTAQIDLDEEELAIYTSMLADKALYKHVGLRIYATKYLEPGVNTETKAFYPVRKEIEPIVNLNPNIDDKSKCINSEIREAIDKKLEVYANPLNTETPYLATGSQEEHERTNQAQELYNKLIEDTIGDTGTGLVDPNSNQGSSTGELVNPEGSADSNQVDGLGNTNGVTPEQELQAEGSNLFDDELIID